MRFVLVVCLASIGCGGASRQGGPAVGRTSAPPEAPIAFAFDSLDERPVSSDALRGKISVVTFITTGKLASQAQVGYLVSMANHDGDRVNYALVALEPRSNRDLVEIYRSKLSVSFPVALASDDALRGDGPFGDLTSVPTTFVLDKTNHVLWKHEGLAKSEEVRAAMRGLSP